MNIAFIVYRRADLTARVFAEIRRARPERLFVIADGPKQNVPGESEAISAVRAIVDCGVDWPCEVMKDYSVCNLGCRKRVSSGLNWVFSHVEDAIILEDDCLPHPDFFPFCVDLLDRYRTTAQVMHIGASNLQKGRRRGPASYYFSRYGHVWGWATWRRAWKLYDSEMTRWEPLGGRQWLARCLGRDDEVAYFSDSFEGVQAGTIDSWAFVWMFSLWSHGGVAITSQTNLVSNMGVDSRGTHILRRTWMNDVPTEPISFPLLHPSLIKLDQAADRFAFLHVFMSRRQRARKVFRQWTNKHWYGRMVRQLPFVGEMWTRHRDHHRSRTA